MSYSVNNPQLREEAKAVVQQNLGRIILMNIARGAAISGVMTIAMLLFSGNLGSLVLSIEQLSSARYVDTADVLNLVTSLYGMLTLPVVLGAVLSGVLNLGYLNGLIQLTRGATVKASVVLSRVRHVLASLGLPVWTGLKTAAWSLPGYLVGFLGTMTYTQFAGAMYKSGFSFEKLMMIVGAVVMVAGLLLSVILMIVAGYRYAMAAYILADDPIVGVYDAVEKSKAMMAARKFQLFRLCFFYALMTLAVMVGAFLLMLIGGLLTDVIGAYSSLLMLAAMVLMIVALVILSLQQQMALAFFYERHRNLQN